jgi:small-conductance mechanosensitive channel
MTNPPTTAKQLHQFVQDVTIWINDHTTSMTIAALVSITLVAVFWTIRTVIVRMLRPEPGSGLGRRLLYRLARKAKLSFALIIALWLTARYGMAPAEVMRVVGLLATIALTLQGAIWVRELIIGMVEYRAGDGDSHERLGTAMGLIRLLVNVTVFAIAMIVTLDNLGINVTGLVAGLGIGGIAIGLAAQGIFSDLFAALSIIFDKPFKVGDMIRFDTMTGTVEAIGLKSTRIRAQSGDRVIISNTNLLGKELHNLAEVERRRIEVRFGIVYHTPANKVAALPGLLDGLIRRMPQAQTVRCGLIGFGPSSLDYDVAFDLAGSSLEDLFTVRHQFCIDMLMLLREQDIQFAYPTQTTFTAGPDGNLVMPWAPAATPATTGGPHGQ